MLLVHSTLAVVQSSPDYLRAYRVALVAGGSGSLGVQSEYGY